MVYMVWVGGYMESEVHARCGATLEEGGLSVASSSITRWNEWIQFAGLFDEETPQKLVQMFRANTRGDCKMRILNSGRLKRIIRQGDHSMGRFGKKIGCVT